MPDVAIDRRFIYDRAAFGLTMRILWGSEQPTRQTGYGRVTRELAKHFVAAGHEVFVMGWEYTGEDFKHEEGWTLVDCGIPDGKFGGELILGDKGPTVLERNLHRYQPDVYVSLTDIWHIPHAIKSCNAAKIPYVAYMPIDGTPIPEAWGDILKHLHTPLFMSGFGGEQFSRFVQQMAETDPAWNHYIENPAASILHGVDTEIFKPISADEKAAIRERLNVPPEWKTIFSSVGRNVNRKQLPRLLEAFNLFLEKSDGADAGMILHTGDPENHWQLGWHLPSLIKRLGLEGRVIFSDIDANPCLGLPTTDLAQLYQIADAHILATGGEGFGLPSLEAMACGIPIILPDNSTGPELIRPEAGNIHNNRGYLLGENGILVRCATSIAGSGFGVQMGLVDISALAEAMAFIHGANINKNETAFGKNGRELAESLSWSNIADQFIVALEKAAGSDHHLTQATPTDEEE